MALLIFAGKCFHHPVRQSKGRVKVYGKGDEKLECWISHKIILRKPDAPNGDMPIDVNYDGNCSIRRW
jgi:hypothetical protein